jgi:hypothetical protein
VTAPVDVSSSFGTGGSISMLARDNAILSGTGALNAAGAQNGGMVRMSGNTLAISNASAVSVPATSAGMSANTGNIDLFASRLALIDGKLNATGASGGGTIRAQSDLLNTTGSIDASALSNGNGGMITLNGTQGNVLSGGILSRGGSAGGNGGTVTISAPNFVTGTADVTATKGTPGTVAR